MSGVTRPETENSVLTYPVSALRPYKLDVVLATQIPPAEMAVSRYRSDSGAKGAEVVG
jgi:hypothetical protein